MVHLACHRNSPAIDHSWTGLYSSTAEKTSYSYGYAMGSELLFVPIA